MITIVAVNYAQKQNKLDYTEIHLKDHEEPTLIDMSEFEGVGITHIYDFIPIEGEHPVTTFRKVFYETYGQQVPLNVQVFKG